MVRRKIIVAAGLVAAVSLSVSAARDGQNAGGGALESLLQRIGEAKPGTYVMNGSAIEPASIQVPALVQADVLKGQNRTPRVPVVVGAELPSAAEIRLRVVSVGAAGQSPRVMGSAAGSAAPGRARFVHEFALAPGEYEGQAVIGQSRADGSLTTVVAKSRFTVPDLWGGTLTLTPVVLGESSSAARRGDLSPFNFGPTALAPAVKSQFGQDGSIRVAFRIFNWSAKAEEKPDLTVEYLFYQQGAKRLYFFNKIKPQQLTAATLGDDFDAAGGAVNAGMQVPLAAFTFGDFELKVSVTDNRSKQSAERTVRFTVSP